MFSAAETSPATSIRPASKKRGGSTASSKISNGSAFVPGVDQRSVWVRRAKDVEASILGELGGADQATAQQRLLVRKIATLETELNSREQRFAEAGAATDEELGSYATIVNAQRRLLADIGIDRRVARDVTPTVRDYITEQASRRASAAASARRDAEDVEGRVASSSAAPEPVEAAA